LRAFLVRLHGGDLEEFLALIDHGRGLGVDDQGTLPGFDRRPSLGQSLLAGGGQVIG